MVTLAFNPSTRGRGTWLSDFQVRTYLRLGREKEERSGVRREKAGRVADYAHSLTLLKWRPGLCHWLLTVNEKGDKPTECGRTCL